MINKLIKWLIKRLVIILDRNDDLLCYSFSGGERKDYSVSVERFYDDYYTVGTAMYPYPDSCIKEVRK